MNAFDPCHLENPIPLVLTIAGSDPSGGAGIQGDIKAIEANGAFALSVITTVTAQNSVEFQTGHDLPLRIIKAQMQSLFEDFRILAVKTGMLSSKAIVKCIAALLKKAKIPNIVVDPVMRSKDQSTLLKTDALKIFKKELIPLATLLTPNVAEAEIFTGKKIRTISDAENAARNISKFGSAAVLIKGGHLSAAPAHDILFDGHNISHFRGEFINSPHTHGTGCTYASAIATQLALGKPLKEAVAAAKDYVTEAIRHGLNIGQGQGPTDHFYFLRRKEGESETPIR